MSALAALAKPRRLSLARRAALGAEVVATYARVRLMLRRRDLRAVVTRLRGSTAATPAGADHAAALRLARAAAIVLRPLPGDTRCLTASLVVCALLARRGVRAAVVIGVRPGTPFGAHAWPEVGGRPLLSAGESRFERLVEL